MWLGPNYHRSFHLMQPGLSTSSWDASHARWAPHSDNKGKLGIVAVVQGFCSLGSWVSAIVALGLAAAGRLWGSHTDVLKLLRSGRFGGDTSLWITEIIGRFNSANFRPFFPVEMDSDHFMCKRVKSDTADSSFLIRLTRLTLEGLGILHPQY
jgi:hypothetical protein